MPYCQKKYIPYFILAYFFPRTEYNVSTLVLWYCIWTWLHTIRFSKIEVDEITQCLHCIHVNIMCNYKINESNNMSVIRRLSTVSSVRYFNNSYLIITYELLQHFYYYLSSQVPTNHHGCCCFIFEYFFVQVVWIQLCAPTPRNPYSLAFPYDCN